MAVRARVATTSELTNQPSTLYKKYVSVSPQASSLYRYIETRSALESVLGPMKQAERIALDTEADSLHHYFEKVCLIQLTLTKETYIVDPLSGMDLSQFFHILAGKPLILHGGDYDLRMLRGSFGFRPKRQVFDTMVAAQLLGYRQVGLAALVEHFFGVTLTKRGRKSDWSRRPLTPAQLEYASADTRYLEALAERFFGELRQLARWDWYTETCDRMVQSSARERAPQDPDRVWRIKGSSRLDPRQLVFVRQLWRWREGEAKRANLPPFKIMGNERLLDLAVWAASHPTDSLMGGPKLPRHCTGGRLRALREAIRVAHQTPRSDWPEGRMRRRTLWFGPDCRPQVEALQRECSRVAARLGLAPPVIAPRATLEAIARKRPTSIDGIVRCGLMRWQARLLEVGIRRVMKRCESKPNKADGNEKP